MTNKEKAILQGVCLACLLNWEEHVKDNTDDEMRYFDEGAYRVTRHLCERFGIPYPVATVEEEEENEGI